jgi:two-component system, NtrC family, sensor kinase
VKLLQFYRDRKLSHQLLFWFLLISLAPFLIISSLTYRNAVDSLEQELTRSLFSIAQRQARQIENYGDEREQDIATLVHVPAVAAMLTRDSSKPGGADDPQLTSLLNSYSDLGTFEDFFLIRPDGRIVLSHLRLEAAGTNVHSSMYTGTQLQRTFDRALTLLGTDVSDFETPADGSGSGAFIGAPVFSSGRLVGVMLLRMGTREIFRVVSDRTGLGQTGETVVARQSGSQILYVAPLLHDPHAEFRRTAAPDSREGVALLPAVSGTKGSGLVTDYRGKEVLAAWWYLPFFRWGIMVKMDADEAFAPVKRLQFLFALVGLSTSVLVAFVALRVATSLSKPIEKLTRATELVQAGQLDHRIDIEGKNEIGKLAQSFNAMSERLHDIISHLDVLVAARTSELGEKNSQLEKTLQQLKDAQQQIVMQEKMASLGGLTAGIAHEIKNPLNFVNNFAELSMDLIRELRAEAPDAAPDILSDLELNVQKINEHGKRADSIVKGMLLHARGTPGELRPTDINALLDEYVNLAYHGLRAKDSSFNVTLERDYDSSIGEIPAVPQDISRVFLNIVNNGCYSAHQKKQELGDSFSPTVRVQSRAAGDWCEIRIRDNGKGVPQSVRDKIFNPFFTTKPAGEGTGLGLSLSYDTVVQGHKGELRLETEEGEFAEFIIRLPRKRNSNGV